MLCRADTPVRLWESVRYRAEMQQWWPHLFLAMPDHVHALLTFAAEPGMRNTMSDWKRYTARECGIDWQRDFLDHRLRKDESLVEKAHYIRLNPVRANLVREPGDWPYVWMMDGDLGEDCP